MADIQRDGLVWWQRAVANIVTKARNLAVTLSRKALGYWQQRDRDAPNNRHPDEKGRDR